jgi:methylmalonyl-CoA mutase
MAEDDRYRLTHPVRLVTAAALFDGHDASINIMRRILQASGAEVIHLGHNRAVEEVALAAVQEDAQAVALTSYQGGHMEYFTYLRERLDALGAGHVRIFGGGGGVIIAREIDELHRRGIDRVFSPEDGRNMGLQGMIDVVLRGADYAAETPIDGEGWMPLARRLTRAELGLEPVTGDVPKVPVVGLTGTGGAGKSSLTDELVRRFVMDGDDRRVGVLCVDPTKRKTGGALLGDRIRLNSLQTGRVYMRSLATRGSGREVSDAAKDVLSAMKQSGRFDVIFVETAGIGQGDAEITELADLTLYVMTAEFGAPSQLEKIEMLDYADFVVINKFTRRGSEDALRDVRKQYQRNHELWHADRETLPVFGTSAAHFNDGGVNALHAELVAQINRRFGTAYRTRAPAEGVRTTDASQHVIPPGRERYLSEISDACRGYRRWAEEQSQLAADVDALARAARLLGGPTHPSFTPFGPAEGRAEELCREHDALLERLDPRCRKLLAEWDDWDAAYRADQFVYQVRTQEIRVDNYVESLSELRVPKVMRPRYEGAGDRLRWRLLENVPGEFPFTAGTFPFKRTAEDPTRMFAGEGPSERTNERFHLLAAEQPAKRLSTAFDSITLYGEDPDRRPDIYGKIGESGVSVFTVEEAERLYAGFDLCDPRTSVSMTINGPAPTVLAFFMNTAIRQRCRRFLVAEGRLQLTDAECLRPDFERGASWAEPPGAAERRGGRAVPRRGPDAGPRHRAGRHPQGGPGTEHLHLLHRVRPALMGDIQQYFIEKNVRNFYSVSISGYHIAEAGANPIHPARLHPRQRLHLRRVLPRGAWTSTASPRT